MHFPFDNEYSHNQDISEFLDALSNCVVISQSRWTNASETTRNWFIEFARRKEAQLLVLLEDDDGDFNSFVYVMYDPFEPFSDYYKKEHFTIEEILEGKHLFY